ncbi:ion transporter [Christiangramia portivictoriae]|uniref:ion transporter n=1 Tax=Christiangramia portivictoriae TaxID=326069 RepID=UPI00041BCD09|nr:ion transporter [Christiangramia portivictoriae]
MTKRKVYQFIHHNSFFINFIYGLIVLNVLLVVLSSYKEIRNDFENLLSGFEVFSVIIFSLEFLLRLWTSDLKYESGNKISKRVKFIISKYGLIDLIAILPFYLPFIIPFDLRVLRILRLFRLLRIFKLGRISKSMQTISSVLRETKSELFVTLFVAAILLVLSSTLMYSIENEAQPEKFENIGQALWWSVATLTTVGYGDVYPVTGIGKVLSAIIALIGIGFVALPTGIISSAFIEKVQKDKKKQASNYRTCKCRNCGEELVDHGL